MASGARGASALLLGVSSIALCLYGVSDGFAQSAQPAAAQASSAAGQGARQASAKRNNNKRQPAAQQAPSPQALNANAQAARTTAVQYLDTITIAASKTEEKAVDALAPVSVVTLEQIQGLQPNRIGDVLRTIPGVSLQDRGDEPSTAVNIRGLQDFGRVAVVVAPRAEPDPTADPDDWPGLAYLVYAPFTSMAPVYTWVPPALHCADLVRDVFGNPYRPAAFSPEWRTETVVAMATGMAAAGDFFPMPVLADALDDAGCTDERILDHCRGHGPHARGCWVLEAILRRIDPAAARPVLARISSFARPA